jgi:CRISPR-associated protein Cst2
MRGTRTHEHQFYRTTLKGLFSLTCSRPARSGINKKQVLETLTMCGKKAAEQGLLHMEKEKAYRLPCEERIKRVTTLFDGMANLDGGAKQTLHYTDVTPPLVIFAVTRGGNHIFSYMVGANKRGLPELKIEALEEALTVYKKEIISDVYVGWVRGYLDEERERLEGFIATQENSKVLLCHPRKAFAG